MDQETKLALIMVGCFALLCLTVGLMSVTGGFDDRQTSNSNRLCIHERHCVCSK